MNRIIKILNILWHGTKVILHLTNKKDKLKKMDEVEKNLRNNEGKYYEKNSINNRT